MVCKSCGKELNVGAKFCGKCGAKVEAVSATENQESSTVDTSVSSECIHWNILPGQLALKIDNKTLNSFGRVKGVIIQEGVKAIFFADGKLAGELGAGKYIFNSFAPEEKKSFDETGLLGAADNVWRGLQRFLVGSSRTPSSGTPGEISVVLIRDSEFPLVFEYKDMPTKGIRSDVALQCVAKITNILSLYKALLIDREFIGFDSFAKNLTAGIQGSLSSVLPQFTPDDISSLPAIQAVLQKLNETVAEIYPFVQIVRIVRLTATREELEEIRRMQEELYISELELAELTKRNNFLNRLNDENNAQALAEARTQADFTAAMNKIDEQNLLTEDEKESFAQTLYAQRQIREAQTNEQIDAALNEIRKAGLLREEEIDVLQSQIAHRAEMQSLTDGQAIALVTLQNEKILDEQKLQWEIEIGNKRIENEIARQRMQDNYADERRKAEMDLDTQEMTQQMNLLRQAQAIREERENAEHQREMESRQQEINAQQDMTKIYAGMTAEQIMVANPNITPEAANAMAEKFKADASDDKLKMALNQKDEMRQFMEQQMDLMRGMVTGQNAAKDEEA